MKLSEAAKKAIDLAEKVSDYYSRELPKRHPHYPLIYPGEETAPPPPEEQELRDFLKGLPEETILQLILVMNLGRGDVAVDDLAGSYEELKRTFGKPEFPAFQMLEKASLADYLSEGLEELKQHRIKVDKLPLKKATA